MENVCVEKESHGVIIGVGSEYGGDDRLGLEFVRRLQISPQKDFQRWGLFELDGDLFQMIPMLRGQSFGIVVDALLDPARDPGEIVICQAHDENLMDFSFSLSTHGVGVFDVLDLARSLGDLPCHCLVIGIVASLQHSHHLSPPVSLALDQLLHRLPCIISESLGMVP